MFNRSPSVRRMGSGQAGLVIFPSIICVSLVYGGGIARVRHEESESVTPRIHPRLISSVVLGRS